MKCDHRAPNVTITLSFEDDAGNECKHKLLCEYYVDPEDRSVGLFGIEFIVEGCYWEDSEESVPDPFYEKHKEDITELARIAWESECEASYEP